MQKLIILWLLSLLFIGCQNKGTNKQDSGDTTLKQNKPKTYISPAHRDKYYDLDFALTDSLIKNNFCGFKYVKNHWKKSFVTDFNESERIIEFMKLDSLNLLLVTRTKESCFIHHFDTDGNLMQKKELDYSEHKYFSGFLTHNNKLYFSGGMGNVKARWEYNWDSLNLKQLEKPDDYKHLFSRAFNLNLYSPDSTHMLKHDYEGLYLIDEFGNEDTLVNLWHNEYPQDWCFENFCWDETGNKLYFDNSAEVACIWEIDFINKTVDKIIPEHYAERPVYAGNSLFYIYENCIYKCQFIDYGSEVNLKDPHLYDTVSAFQLNENNYFITLIDSLPAELKYEGTKPAYLAIKNQKSAYKLKLLFAQDSNQFIETAALTLMYDDYKCNEPIVYYSDGKVVLECNNNQGITYREYFLLEKLALRYEKSLIYKLAK